MKKRIDESFWMYRAIEIAKRNALKNTLPISSILVNNNFEIGIGVNFKDKTKINTNHSEANAIKQAIFYSSTTQLKNSTIYTTLEPCLMCTALILSLKIKSIIFSTYRNKKISLQYKYTYKKHSITGGVLNNNNKKIIANYFIEKRKSN